MVERGNVGTDVIAGRLVHSRTSPKEIDILCSYILALVTAPDGSDGVVANCHGENESVIAFKRKVVTMRTLVGSGSVTSEVDKVDVGNLH